MFLDIGSPPAICYISNVQTEGMPKMTGPAAIAAALDAIDLDSMEKESMDIVKSKKKTARPDAIRRLNLLEGFRRTGVHPRDLMLTRVPVIPAKFRPFNVVGDTFVPGDANELYRDLIDIRDSHGFLEKELGTEGAAHNHLNIYDAVSAVYGYGDPVKAKTRERGVSGFLTAVTGCHDDETEILTSKYGWVKLKDLPEDTEVATVNPTTLEFEWQQPTAYQHYRYIGELIHFNNGKGTDVLVTPSHRMWLRRQQQDDGVMSMETLEKNWEIVPAHETVHYTNRHWFQMASKCWNDGEAVLPEWVTCDYNDFAEFVGWWVAEGWIHSDRHAAELCQSNTANGPYCLEINSLVSRLGFRFSYYPYEGKNTWSIQDKRLVTWISENCGEGANFKVLSKSLLNWPTSMLKRFFKGYLKGDGSKRTNDISGKVGITHKFRDEFTDSHAGFSTTSPKLFDGLMEIGMKIGFIVRRNKDHPHLRPAHHAEAYAGSVLGRWQTVREQSSAKFVDYDGYVHCCTVPNGLLITRRNYKPIVSGNSSPKFSMTQRRLISKPVDFVGRGVASLDPELSLDQVGIPEDMAWKLYAPYVQRRLVRAGNSPVDAVQMIQKRHELAAKHLQLEMKDRPVMYSRAPAWHKFNVLGGYPKIVQGDSIMANSLVGTGLGLDHDGDQMNVHLPGLPEAVDDVKNRLMPSKMLFSIKDPEKVMPVPKHEVVLGLHSAKNSPAKNKWKFKTEDEAMTAINSGKVALSDEVEVG